MLMTEPAMVPLAGPSTSAVRPSLTAILSPQTVKVAAELPVPVKAIAFFRPDQPGKRTAEDLLKQYASRSDGKFTWEVVDADRNPLVARQYGFESYGTVALEATLKDGQTKQEKIQDLDEEKLTNALIRVTRPGKRVVYLLKGHGEKDPAKGTPKDKFEAGLKDIIAQIKAGGARVVLCTPTVIGEKKGGANKLDAQLDEYAGVSRKVAEETGSQLCDLRKAFVDYLTKNNAEDKESKVLTTDRVHLNDAGNKLVAETILLTIDK